MAANYNDIIKQGYVKIKSKKMGVWQRRWIILRKASSKGKRRVEKYLEEKLAISGSEAKLIDLTDVKSCSRLPGEVKKNAFVICFEDQAVMLQCEAGPDADAWVQAIHKECSSNSHTINVDLLDSGPCQQESSEKLNVYLLPNPNTDIYGECLIQISSEYLNLYDVHNPVKRLLTWPLNSLRRFGKDSQGNGAKFTFVSGRFCDTGEGLFILNTIHAQEIHDKVSRATQTLAAANQIQRTIQNRSRTNSEASSNDSSSAASTLSRSGTVPPVPSPRTQNTVRPCVSDAGNKVMTGRPLPKPPIENEHGSSRSGRRVPPPPPVRVPLDLGLGRRSIEEGAAAAEGQNVADGERDEQEEYEHQKKNLTPEFRRYLRTRKEDR